MRILVVDEEAAVRESLERVRDDRPDAVVLDVLMPRLDGLEACRRLRARGDDLPVLLLTARDGVADRVNGLDVGADDYLVKPFAPGELLARLRALLRRAGGGGAGDVLADADRLRDRPRLADRGPRQRGGRGDRRGAAGRRGRRPLPRRQGRAPAPHRGAAQRGGRPVTSGPGGRPGRGCGAGGCGPSRSGGRRRPGGRGRPPR